MLQPKFWVFQFSVRHHRYGEGDGLYLECRSEFRVSADIALYHSNTVLLSVLLQSFVYQLHQHLAWAAGRGVEVYKDRCLTVLDDLFVIFVCKFHKRSITAFALIIRACYNQIEKRRSIWN